MGTFVQLPGKVGRDISSLLNVRDRKQRWQEILKYARSKELTEAEIKSVLIAGWQNREEHYFGIMALVGEQPYFGENELPF